jgi:hypothetical protein
VRNKPKKVGNVADLTALQAKFYNYLVWIAKSNKKKFRE